MIQAQRQLFLVEATAKFGTSVDLFISATTKPVISAA